MQYVVITDLYGNKIDKDLDNEKHPFILIHTTQPHLLLEKIVSTDEDGVWRTKFTTMMHVLYSHKINPGRYAPLGDYWYPDNKLPTETQLILVNTRNNISKYPKDYIEIDQYKGATLWRPIGEINYKPIGLVLSAEKPPLNLIRTVNKDLLEISKGKRIVVDNLTNTAGTHLLIHKTMDKLTIDRTKFIAREKEFIISSNLSGKTLNEFVTEKNDEIHPRNIYTQRGEIVINDQCLASSSDGSVKLEKCDSKPNQKWYPYVGNIINQYDGRCLTDRGSLKTEECSREGAKDQRWLFDDLHQVIEDVEQEKIDHWTTSNGKRVVLLEPDHPWHINRKVGREPEGIVRPRINELNKVDYRDNADYHTNFMMDTMKSDLGYGHSYADRLGRPCLALDSCKNVPPNPKDRFILENFNEGKVSRNKINYIASGLFCLLISLILVRYYLDRYLD